MQYIERVAVDVAVPVDVFDASSMREADLGGGQGGDEIAVSVDDVSMKKGRVKLASGCVSQCSGLAKGVEDEIFSRDTDLHVKTVHSDRGHGASQRVSCQENLLGQRSDLADGLFFLAFCFIQISAVIVS